MIGVNHHSIGPFINGKIIIHSGPFPAVNIDEESRGEIVYKGKQLFIEGEKIYYFDKNNKRKKFNYNPGSRY